MKYAIISLPLTENRLWILDSDPEWSKILDAKVGDKVTKTQFGYSREIRGIDFYDDSESDVVFMAEKGYTRFTDNEMEGELGLSWVL